MRVYAEGFLRDWEGIATVTVSQLAPSNIYEFDIISYYGYNWGNNYGNYYDWYNGYENSDDENDSYETRPESLGQK